GTLDVGLIDSVCVSDNPDRPNSFVIITANRVLKKRWFVLTSSSLDYYNTSERSGAKLGTLVLNSLCSIVQPDEKVFKESVQKEKGYSSLQDEAVKIFNSLQEMEAAHESGGGAAGQAGHTLERRHTSFLEGTLIKELFPGSEIELFAHFIGESLKKIKCREYVPSQEEIVALLTRQWMTTTLYCHGGGSCKISIKSHTTAGEVVEKLIRGLAMEDSRNMFALFEHRNIDRAVESRVIVSDVLAKFERLAGSEDEEDEGQWKLYFKLYCFLDVESMPKEGAHESLTSGHFPALEETLQHLAALRLQFLHGDKARVGWVLENVYPMGRLRSRILHFTKAGGGGAAGHTLERRHTSFLEGTLRRGLKTGSMKKQRMEEEQMLEMRIKEETSATRASVLEKWSRLWGLDQHQAMLKYMTIIKEWPGHAVRRREGGFPHDLWLSVSAENISVYKRGDPKPLETFPYEHILRIVITA
ncbi:hypothetical protein CRUP_023158, partial [Coryphaenoides rupestris]